MTSGGHFTKLKNFEYTKFGNIRTTPSGHFTKLKNFEHTKFGNVQMTPSGHFTKLNSCTPLKKVPKFSVSEKLKFLSILLCFIENEYF